MKRILAATDLSKRTWHAVRRAAMIAKQHGADLSLVHVIGHSTLLMGSVTCQILAGSKCDVLVVHNEQSRPEAS
jgi:nucleotide-binding universal stress UspA family protein